MSVSSSSSSINGKISAKIKISAGAGIAQITIAYGDGTVKKYKGSGQPVNLELEPDMGSGKRSVKVTGYDYYGNVVSATSVSY